MTRSSFKKAEEEIITLYKNIIILIRVAMKAIDQIVGLKAQRVSSKNNFIQSRLDSHNLTGFITTIFQHIQVFFLQLAIFLKAGSTTDNILAYGLL